MGEREQLRSAIETLYTVFARYPCPTAIEYCPCGCTKAEEVIPLLAAPLAELEFDQLGKYSFSAVTTQGSVDDFKYFLPRLFEGVAREKFDYGLEILFGKPDYAKWMTWNEDEINAVRAYMNAFWRSALSAYPLEESHPALFEIETLLACLAQTGECLAPNLAIWEETSTQQADRQLLQFVTMYGSDFSDGKVLSFAFWEHHTEQAQELRRWILKPVTLDRIIRSKHLLSIDGYEHLFPKALESLYAESNAVYPKQ